MRKEIKKYKRLKRSGAEPIAEQVVIIICAILLPPLSVYLYEGEITNRFWISLLLTLLFFVPGMIYSLLVVTDTIWILHSVIKFGVYIFAINGSV